MSHYDIPTIEVGFQQQDDSARSAAIDGFCRALNCITRNDDAEVGEHLAAAIVTLARAIDASGAMIAQQVRAGLDHIAEAMEAETARRENGGLES